MKKRSIITVYTTKLITGVFMIFLFWGFISADRDTPAQIVPKKAEILRDPRNKHNISGYVHIAFTWGQQLRPPQNLLRGLINLKNAMLKWTKIEARIDKHLYLSSPTLLKMPFVYITTTDLFELTETEKKNVKQYFDNGGFMVLEAATSLENSPAEASLKQMLRDTLGAHARFTPVPMSHPLFHCFFDFEYEPPQGAEYQLRDKPVHYLEGVWYKDRLVAVYSNKFYIRRWNDMSNNDPQLKMGVNMIVYSLIQEGGIASQ